MEIEDPTTKNQVSKPNVGVRVPVKTKDELIQESKELGMSISELVECHLLNRHKHKKEVEDLKKSLECEREKIELLNKQLEAYKKVNPLQQSNDVVQMENLLNTDRLKQLFAVLSGKADEINLPDGKKMLITYNRPIDVLTAMIYSFKLKNTN